ncbi:MAG: hypothetical protein ABIS47_13020 [Acidimicrobiales bacterium]
MTDEVRPDERSPVEQALEIFVFAPLGLAMTARTQLPEMVAKGRAQVEGQLTLARFVGQFAVKHGRAEVEKRLKAYTTPPGPTEAGPRRGSADAEAPIVTVPLTVLAEPAPEPAPEPPAVPTASPDLDLAPAPPAADLAIPGYDALSASHVVQRLAGLSPAELEQVRSYEAATRGRKTVLTKISQLQ